MNEVNDILLNKYKLSSLKKVLFIKPTINVLNYGNKFNIYYLKYILFFYVLVHSLSIHELNIYK